ncbi:MAG: hypothetical protein HOQ21_17720 [Dermatophilaceae bacterium]|nr:hypothetical protein [Dermatophilaceae bacterium]
MTRERRSSPVFAGTILIGLNATMLSVALPTVVGDLGASPAQGTWMLLAYLVVAGAGLVLSGQLADCLDLSAVFRAGLAAFGVASLVLLVTTDAAVFIEDLQITPLAAAVTVGTLAVGRLARERDNVITSRHAAGVALVGRAVLVVALYADAPPAAVIAGLVVVGLGCGAFQTVNGSMIIAMGGLTRAGTLNGSRSRLLRRARGPSRAGGRRRPARGAPHGGVGAALPDGRRAARGARSAPPKGTPWNVDNSFSDEALVQQTASPYILCSDYYRHWLTRSTSTRSRERQQ